jgi:hypothetical protein
MPSMARVDEIAAVIDGGNTARELLGGALRALSPLYEVVSTWDPLGAADQVTGQGKEYLDGIRVRAEEDYRLIPSGNGPLADKLRRQIAFDIASVETATGQTLDEFKGTIFDDVKSWGADLAKQAADKLPDLLPNASSVWIYVAAVVVFVAWLKFRKG